MMHEDTVLPLIHTGLTNQSVAPLIFWKHDLKRPSYFLPLSYFYLLFSTVAVFRD